MAQLDVPQELLGTVNVDEVLNRFRRIFRQLDDLKKFRTQHEERNAWSRWWNSDQLETAQLDAQQVQAEFSKTLGQLMVISMFQARRLESQQGQLLNQQREIKHLSESIERNAKELADEHSKLYEQGDELKRLVRDSFDIQYTLETERKLLVLASQVAKSKDHLVAAFDERLTEARKLSEQTERIAVASIERLTESFDQRVAELDAHVRAEMENFIHQCRELETRWTGRVDTVQKDVAAQLNAVTERVQTFELDLKAVAMERAIDRQTTQQAVGNLHHELNELREVLAEQSTALQKSKEWAAGKVRRIHLSIIGTIAVFTAVWFGVGYMVLNHVSATQ